MEMSCAHYGLTPEIIAGAFERLEAHTNNPAEVFGVSQSCYDNWRKTHNNNARRAAFAFLMIAEPEARDQREDYYRKCEKAEVLDLSCLTEREAWVIEMRYAIGRYQNSRPKTLEEVSRKIGRTRESVRRIQGDAIEKLRRRVCVTLVEPKTCPTCKGSGTVQPSEYAPGYGCPFCKGKGTIVGALVSWE